MLAMSALLGAVLSAPTIHQVNQRVTDALDGRNIQLARLPVQQDPARLQHLDVLAMTRDALVEKLVVRVDGIEQLHPAGTQRVH